VRIQLLSDLHLESEEVSLEPADGAELLVLAGDIDSTWRGYERFAGWPVPVVAIAGNHEFDRRELDEAWPALRAHCAAQGITLLEQQIHEAIDDRGRRVRVLGTVRWSDFDVFGPERLERSIRAGAYFQRVMGATLGGSAFDVEAVRREAQTAREWLAASIAQPSTCDATVVVTHFAPSLACADPRYGSQPGTASFCNADEALMDGVDLWLHGHVHSRHDLRLGATRVVSRARGLARRGEADGWRSDVVIEV
jgi:DNA repair exonuclease SbcCD nuclease subunit